MFYDDFECVNPLGSKTKKHKIGAIYFSIRNFPPKMLSQLDNIFLLTLFYVDDINKSICNFNDILRSLFRDLKILETIGFDLNWTVIKGALVCICYDNLGGNVLLGLSESFSAHYFCRFCITKNCDMQNIFSEKKYNLTK